MSEFPETRSRLLVHLRSPGNRDAWEEFVLLYRPVIYRMARRRGMQDADALDLVQTVMGRVAGAIDRWEPQGPEVRFRHWLRRIARNAILNALTRAPRDLAAGGSGMQELLAEQPADQPEVDRELELEATREQYLRAAATVRRDVDAITWQAFELTVIDGRPCDVAADLLGRSVGSIHAARSRVMRRLQDQVQQLEDDSS